MSERILGINIRILDSDDVERSDLQLVFDGARVFYRDSEGVEHQRQTLLGADFLIEPFELELIMYQFGG